MTLSTKQQGFTIVELMIATAVFSGVLVIVTAGIISFSRSYYKGVITNSTQTVTRNVATEISQSIQLGRGTVTSFALSGGVTNGYCINGKPYYFVVGKQINGPNPDTATKHALVTATNACTALTELDLTTLDISNPPSGLENPRELLGDKMRLAVFDVTANQNPATINIRIVYGDDDLLTGSGGTLSCRAGSGGQFCAASGLNTSVAVRLE